MTRLDKASKMPARALLYGFLGFIAVAGAVTMFSDPLDPEIGNNSTDPADWSESKLKVYLSDNGVEYAGDDSRRALIRLVKKHMKAQERARQSEADPLLPKRGGHETGTSAEPGSEGESGSRTPSAAAQAANERLLQASNLT